VRYSSCERFVEQDTDPSTWPKRQPDSTFTINRVSNSVPPFWTEKPAAGWPTDLARIFYRPYTTQLSITGSNLWGWIHWIIMYGNHSYSRCEMSNNLNLKDLNISWWLRVSEKRAGSEDSWHVQYPSSVWSGLLRSG